MVYFCPQCGTKVAQGTSVCPQCGVTLRYVVQKNAENNTLNAEVMMAQKRKNVMFNQTVDTSTENLQDTVPVLKYNSEYASPNDVAINAESDMSSIGYVDELPEMPVEAQQDPVDNEKMYTPSSTADTPQTVAETAKYKIITQVYDKKLGFNATELERKLNMYAKLGYTIVPNTMICQPGQDFFVLLEKTPQNNDKDRSEKPEVKEKSKDNKDSKEEDTTAKDQDNE